MGFLKKKDKHEADTSGAAARPRTSSTNPPQPVPEFTFMRTTTNTQEVITPPAFPGDRTTEETRGRFSKLSFKSRLRSHSGAEDKERHAAPRSPPTSPPAKLEADARGRPNAARRLSHRLGLKRELSSTNIPDTLPDIPTSTDAEHNEGEWEKRATILARSNEISRSQSRNESPDRMERGIGQVMGLGIRTPDVIGSREGIVGSPKVDDNIQEAIRLHEEGSLEEATRMFGRLADPAGHNNALSQVLYGLALRHGWGCEADPERAVQFLSAAASNAASIEEAALTAGSKNGGSAKGELVLAIYELANSYKNGWGVKKDPVAAKHYLEVAANLGDTDAMNEVAWCYLQGFGCKKDKMQAAKYYRLAEKGGNKTLGNSWIWKPKYDACGVDGLKVNMDRIG